MRILSIYLCYKGDIFHTLERNKRNLLKNLELTPTSQLFMILFPVEDLAITLLFVLMSVCLSVPLILLPRLQNIFTKQVIKGTVLQNVFTKQVIKGTVLQDILTKQVIKRTVLQNIYTKQVIKETVLQNIFTKQVIKGTVLQNIFTKQVIKGLWTLFHD